MKASGEINHEKRTWISGACDLGKSRVAPQGLGENFQFKRPFLILNIK